MKIKQMLREAGEWSVAGKDSPTSPQLVLFFGSRSLLEEGDCYRELRSLFPDAHIIGCSTAGEIFGDEVLDDTVVACAVEFDKTAVCVSTLLASEVDGSCAAGRQLAEQLPGDGLASVLVISDGQVVNGSELVEGIVSVVGSAVTVTGGLAGDGGNFEKTMVSCDCAPESGRIALVGLYGDSVKVGHGSVGGWDPFGPAREITRSESNVLHELDGKPALELYKSYLGEKASELPGSALLFPLMIKPMGQSEVGTVRTVLAVDEDANTMTFAGDVPQGYTAQLMMANFERLVAGAGSAAHAAELASTGGEQLAILISCVGRKMVLGQRVADEVESVQDILGAQSRQIGFYSYGEISPHVEVGDCQLHNQTMTITTIAEI